MITALEKHRVYRIGIGDKAKDMLYIGRHFPDDHPPVFSFEDTETGIVTEFLLPQLTVLEKNNGLHFGPKHIG